jgi:ribosomal protein L37AE/L43A
MKFNGFDMGYCIMCGDTIGPWELHDGFWLCEKCGKEYEKDARTNLEVKNVYEQGKSLSRATASDEGDERGDDNH